MPCRFRQGTCFIVRQDFDDTIRCPGIYVVVLYRPAMPLNEVPSQLDALTPPGIQRVVLHSLVEEAQKIVQTTLVFLACPSDGGMPSSNGVAVILDWLRAEASTLRAVRHGRLDAKQPSYKLYQPKHECAQIFRYIVEI